MRSVSKGTVGAVLTAVAFRIRFVDTRSGLIIAEVVSPLGVARSSMQEETSGVKRTHKKRKSLVERLCQRI